MEPLEKQAVYSSFLPRGVVMHNAPFLTSSIFQGLTIAEDTAIDLTLTIFKINTVMRAIEICHFTFLSGRSAKGAGEFPDRFEHCFASSSFHFLMT